MSHSHLQITEWILDPENIPARGKHYGDVIMGTMASQITSLTIV